MWTAYVLVRYLAGNCLCFSTAVQDLCRKERCSPRQKSGVERIKARVESLLVMKKENGTAEQP